MNMMKTQVSFLVVHHLSWKIIDKLYINYEGYLKKRLLLRCIHHFKSDLINNMDHMCITGSEPSSVILSQTK